MTPTLATRTDTLLSIENVSLSYGSNVVLRDVNISIQDLVRPGCVTGQIVGILGPSGIGKSTLLRIIAGLQKPTSGEVYVGSSHRPVKAGDVGVVCQNYLVYRNRTVVGNLVVAAKQAADSPGTKEAARRAVAALADFGLVDKADLYPSQLSGGQRQRLAIARQMLAASDFLVFDEPTAGLDPLAKDNVCSLIARLANRSEIQTVLLVSHDIPSVVAMCDTIWLIGRTKNQPGANIVGIYDMIGRGLMWREGIRRTPEFANIVRELQDEFQYL